MKQAQITQCVICQEAITNPICPACLAKEIKVWLNEVKPEWTDKIVEPFEDRYGTRCISCGKGMSICAHCYSKDVYEFLLEEDHELAKQFLEHFNYDIDIPSIFI